MSFGTIKTMGLVQDQELDQLTSSIRASKLQWKFEKSEFFFKSLILTNLTLFVDSTTYSQLMKTY